MSNVSQSLFTSRPVQVWYKNLLFYCIRSLTKCNNSRLHYYDFTTRKQHFVYQHYFCNTELRTAIITKIKGLSIQTQQNTFVLFTLFKLTSDERKTLTKISMCKTPHNHSPKPAHASDTKEQENPTNNQNKEKEKRPFA